MVDPNPDFEDLAWTDDDEDAYPYVIEEEPYPDFYEGDYDALMEFLGDGECE